MVLRIQTILLFIYYVKNQNNINFSYFKHNTEENQRLGKVIFIIDSYI